jgi:hypothetical protein
VSCLSYGNVTAVAAQAQTLSDTQSALAQQALPLARSMVNPSAGILGTATGKSSDHTGEGTVIFYVDPSKNVDVPQTVDGVRTEVIPTTAEAVSNGSAPQAIVNVIPPLESSVLSQAVAAKEQVAQSLMHQNPGFFGVGVGQSFDNPREASLVIYVDRKQVPISLPPTINGLRVRYVIMDRLHVTRSYLTGPVRSQSHCMTHSPASLVNEVDPFGLNRPPALDIF